MKQFLAANGTNSEVVLILMWPLLSELAFIRNGTFYCTCLRRPGSACFSEKLKLLKYLSS